MYGLRLTDVMREWHPVEVVALFHGLASTRSRYAAQVQGYHEGKSWTDLDYLTLDARNSVEGLRATVIGALSKKKSDAYREWTMYPGRAAATRKRAKDTLAKYRRLAGDTGTFDVGR